MRQTFCLLAAAFLGACTPAKQPTVFASAGPGAFSRSEASVALHGIALQRPILYAGRAGDRLDLDWTGDLQASVGAPARLRAGRFLVYRGSGSTCTAARVQPALFRRVGESRGHLFSQRLTGTGLYCYFVQAAARSDATGKRLLVSEPSNVLIVVAGGARATAVDRE